MLPAAHVVGPVHPLPPHCPYFAATAVEVLVGALLVAVAVVAVEATEVAVLPLVTL